jgi:hypothetical protein
MDDTQHVDVVKRVLTFMRTYGGDASEVTNKIKTITECLVLMTEYADLPEVWVCKVHQVFSDIVGVLARIALCPQDEVLKDQAIVERTQLIDQLHAFEDKRSVWLREHPRDLEFVFRKLCLNGFHEVKKWGVTDCRTFREIEESDLIAEMRAWQETPFKQINIQQVTELFHMFDKGNVDMPSVLKTYEDNDVDSMHLRRQLIQLSEHMQDGHYDGTTTAVVSAFLHTVAYKLWGWGDFVRQLPDGSTVLRDANALQMTGHLVSKPTVSTAGMSRQRKCTMTKRLTRRRLCGKELNIGYATIHNKIGSCPRRKMSRTTI